MSCAKSGLEIRGLITQKILHQNVKSSLLMEAALFKLLQGWSRRQNGVLQGVTVSVKNQQDHCHPILSMSTCIHQRGNTGRLGRKGTYEQILGNAGFPELWPWSLPGQEEHSCTFPSRSLQQGPCGQWSLCGPTRNSACGLRNHEVPLLHSSPLVRK